jgi:hypothetical protein
MAPLAVGAVLVAAGGVYGLSALNGDSSSPTDPVEQLFDALDKEDMVGALEVLTPAERDILVGRAERLAGELRRIGLADDQLDLNDLAGVDLQVDGLKLESTNVAEDLAEVRVVAGRLTSSADPDQLPLGGELRDLADQAADQSSDGAGEGSDGGATSSADEPQVEDLADHDLRFMVLRRDGKWGVSLGYTIAEAARRDAGLDRPDFTADAVRAAGAPTPAGAVEGLLGAVDDGDVAGLIGRLDPEEMAALYDYAPLFLPDDEQSAQLHELAERITISDLELTATGSGSDRFVTVSAATLTYDDGETRAVLRYADGCVHLTSESGYSPESTRSSGSEVVDLCPGSTTSGLDQDLQDRLGRDFTQRLDDELGGTSGFGGLGVDDLSGLSELSDLFDPSALTGKTGIVVHEVDGSWYVSPTRTFLDNGLAVLGALKDGAVGQLVEAVSSLGSN